MPSARVLCIRRLAVVTVASIGFVPYSSKAKPFSSATSMPSLNKSGGMLLVRGSTTAIVSINDGIRRRGLIHRRWVGIFQHASLASGNSEAQIFLAVHRVTTFALQLCDSRVRVRAEEVAGRSVSVPPAIRIRRQPRRVLLLTTSLEETFVQKSKARRS